MDEGSGNSARKSVMVRKQNLEVEALCLQAPGFISFPLDATQPSPCVRCAARPRAAPQDTPSIQQHCALTQPTSSVLC